MNILPVLSSFLILANANTHLLAKNKTEIKIETSRDNNGNGKKVSVSTSSNLNTNNSVKIENDKFEIRGTVDSVSTNSFTVNSQSISIDPSLVKSYRQKGILEAGQDVKVKGTIQNSVLYAQDVKVMEGALGNFKIDINNDIRADRPVYPRNSSPTENQPTATPNPLVSPSLTPAGNATVSANAKIKIKARGPVDQVIAFLAQVLSLLQNLL